MLNMTIIMNGDGAWPDLLEKSPKDVIHSQQIVSIAILDHGMKSGAPSIAVRIDLPDGKTIIAETSAKLFCSASNAFLAKYPDLLA